MFSSYEVYLFVIAVLAAFLFIFLCEFFARAQVGRFNIPDEKGRAEVEDSLRKTAAQVLGAAAVAIIFAYTLTKDNQTIELTRSQTAATTYAEGIKLLKEDSSTVRAAGIYLIEKVAITRHDYKEPIAHTLIAFIRQATPKERPNNATHIDVDVKAAVHVLGRTAIIPDWAKSTWNLSGVSLIGADFSWLSGFAGARFEGADLRAANFIGSDLQGAWLGGAEMNDSSAYGPTFTEEMPRTVEWQDYKKYWYSAQFDCATLRRVNFIQSGLRGALFGRADVADTEFHLADLTRADFSQVQNVDKARFGNACATEPPLFPDGFVCKLRKCDEPSEIAPPDCRFVRQPDKARYADAENECRELKSIKASR